VGLPFVILERNTAPNVLCPRPSCDACLSLVGAQGLKGRAGQELAVESWELMTHHSVY